MARTAFTQYDFIAPRQIRFGWGRRSEIGTAAATLGNRAFLVFGSRTLAATGLADEVSRLLRAQSVEPIALAQITREPEIDDVDRAVAQVRRQGVRPGDLVIGVGGGSAIDLAKAVAGLATQHDEASVSDYLEGVGRGLKLESAPLPILALPTTAGAGAEATRNAVISSSKPAFKKSLRADGLMPTVVIVDPELTASLPPAATAQTGMDAITQLIESYVSCRAKPMAQSLALDGIARALPALVTAVEDGSSRPAREAMAHAALLSGLALANSGLGLAHGVAAALGCQFRVSHGLACAVMLPPTLRANRASCERGLAELARAAEIGDNRNAADAAAALIENIEAICQRIGVRRCLSEFGVRPADIPQLVAGARGNSMDGNPRPISDAELTRILEALL